MSKKLKAESFGIEYKVTVKLDKKCRLDARQRAALEGYIEELLEPQSHEILAGHGNNKVELGSETCRVKDWEILNLVPAEPPPQEELPGSDASE